MQDSSGVREINIFYSRDSNYELLFLAISQIILAIRNETVYKNKYTRSCRHSLKIKRSLIYLYFLGIMKHITHNLYNLIKKI